MTDKDPTVGETYKTLTDTQKAALEALIREARKNPFDEEQIVLFAYFMQEASSGSMTTAERRRELQTLGGEEAEKGRVSNGAGRGKNSGKQ